MPAKGLYELEVFGASGGEASGKVDDETIVAKGGKGGHAISYREFAKGATIYVFCGGKGPGSKSGASANSVNGGGVGASTSGSFGATGGGATHIAGVSSALTSIQYSNKNNIYIVAGGGGAGGVSTKDNLTDTSGAINSTVTKGAHAGGDGGGDRGGDGSGGALGGRQVSTGAADNTNFGKGEGYVATSNNSTPTETTSGGGGGWFGGGKGTNGNSGAGGSGYVGGTAGYTFRDRYYRNVNEVGKNDGNGYAFIRYLGCQ